MADISDCVEKIAKLAYNAVSPTVLSADPDQVAGHKRALLIHTGDLKVSDLTDQILAGLPHPPARRGKVMVSSLQSLIDFTNRMKEHSSVLFADATAKTLLAVLDYHEEVLGRTAPSDAPVEARPRWGRFKALFSFPLSRPYTIWSGKNRQAMAQADLAAFLEDNILDILAARDVSDQTILTLVSQLGLKIGSPDELLKVARGFSLTSEEKFKSVANLDTGEMAVAYEQTHTSNFVADVKLPTAFVVAIPVFEGDAAFQLLVRLKYRKKDGALTWYFDIYAIERAFRVAFEEACVRVQVAVDLPLFYGAPAEAL